MKNWPRWRNNFYLTSEIIHCQETKLTPLPPKPAITYDPMPVLSTSHPYSMSSFFAIFDLPNGRIARHFLAKILYELAVPPILNSQHSAATYIPLSNNSRWFCTHQSSSLCTTINFFLQPCPDRLYSPPGQIKYILSKRGGTLVIRQPKHDALDAL
jgi:hypothetical protein